MKSIYLSGKITCHWFMFKRLGQFINEVKGWYWMRKLSHKGFIVYCPHLNNYQVGLSYDEYMTRGFYWIDKCDEVAMMPNWTQSRGAVDELNYAKLQGKKIYFL